MPINTYKFVLTTVCAVLGLFAYGQTMLFGPLTWQRADSAETNACGGVTFPDTDSTPPRRRATFPTAWH